MIEKEPKIESSDNKLRTIETDKESWAGSELIDIFKRTPPPNQKIKKMITKSIMPLGSLVLSQDCLGEDRLLSMVTITLISRIISYRQMIANQRLVTIATAYDFK